MTPFAPSVEKTVGFTKYMASVSTVLSAIHVRLIHASVLLHRNRREWALPDGSLREDGSVRPPCPDYVKDHVVPLACRGPIPSPTCNGKQSRMRERRTSGSG